jgi:hypothetical protein
MCDVQFKEALKPTIHWGPKNPKIRRVEGLQEEKNIYDVTYNRNK